MAISCLGPAGSCALSAASASVSPSSVEGGGAAGSPGAAGNGGASAIRELADAFDKAMAEPGEHMPNPAQPGFDAAGFDAAEPASPAAVPDAPAAAARGADAADARSAVMSPTELLKIQYTVSMLSSDAGGSAEFSKHISEDVEALLKQKD